MDCPIFSVCNITLRIGTSQKIAIEVAQDTPVPKLDHFFIFVELQVSVANCSRIATDTRTVQ